MSRPAHRITLRAHTPSTGYFEAVPGTKKCGESQNPASYMLDAIGAGVGNVGLAARIFLTTDPCVSQTVSTDFVNEYKRSALSRYVTPEHPADL